MTHDGQTLRTFLSQDMTEISEDIQIAALYRVAVRLPPFWPDCPALWFAQAEAQFELASITRQKTKFSYVVSQLHQQHAVEVAPRCLRKSHTTGGYLPRVNNACGNYSPTRK